MLWLRRARDRATGNPVDVRQTDETCHRRLKITAEESQNYPLRPHFPALTAHDSLKHSLEGLKLGNEPDLSASLRFDG